jgi:putative molybdopterin biosynthesis protein
MRQQQFLEVVDRDDAERRWHRAIDTKAIGEECVAIDCLLGRVLARDVRSEIDVPGFDRSNMDGFAVRAADTFGASEERPVRLKRNAESIPTGFHPEIEIAQGTATVIATGGMIPRGADAVVPVEITDIDPVTGEVMVHAARVPGAALSFAGTDIGAGEVVLFSGTKLTSRETGVLAAIGCATVWVQRRPRIAILSTGDEIRAPGEELRPGLVYDSNSRILADAVTELGGEAWVLPSVPDDLGAVRSALAEAIAGADLVLLSGGTSKGEGDLNAFAVAELEPGVIVHGVALKPGKPICLAAAGEKPVVILPGFPTSAIFTFYEFVAPVLLRLSGARPSRRGLTRARLAVDTVSERGRLEYLLVGLVEGDEGLVAYPMGKGSGSVTAFSRADGFVRIERNTERVDSGCEVDVRLLAREVSPADLIMIGSHCIGLDAIASVLARQGLQIKVLAVGSQAGLAAAQRGECDAAPIHLLDPETDSYNAPFLGEDLVLLPGYRRMQGIVTRVDETRAAMTVVQDPAARMVNRNRGAGTRILIDSLLGDRRPPGHAFEPRSHFAVARAVEQKRADWGVTIETVAKQAGLAFAPLRAEHYDFAIPRARWDRPGVTALRRALQAGGEAREALLRLGFKAP